MDPPPVKKERSSMDHQSPTEERSSRVDHQSPTEQRSSRDQSPTEGPPPSAQEDQDSGRQQQMSDARRVLMVILDVLRLLSCQGIPIQREILREDSDDDDDDEGNLIPLLRLVEPNVPELQAWLKRQDHGWVSLDNLNEMSRIMADGVLSMLLEEVRSAECFSVVLDEVEDSVQRTVSVCLRFVTEELETEELFVGFRPMTFSSADALFRLLQEDILESFSLPISRCRGQCYYGEVGDISAVQTGLQAPVQDLEPRALYVHCPAEVLGLVFQDVATAHVFDVYRTFMAVGEILEIIRLTKDLPERPNWFQDFQDKDFSSSSLRPLFRTSNTAVDTALLHSISSNYIQLMVFLEELTGAQNTHGSGQVLAAAVKAHTLLPQLDEFATFFSLQLMLKTFSGLDAAVTAELRDHPLDFGKAGQVLDALRDDLASLREEFQPFWESTVAAAQDLDLESPVLPKTKTVPQGSGGAGSPPSFQTPEDMYRQQYLSVFETALSSLNFRLSESVFKHLRDVEDFLVGRGDCRRVVRFYGDDFDEARLTLERDSFLDMAARRRGGGDVPLSTFNDMVEFLKGQEGRDARSRSPEITRLVKQVLSGPVSAAASGGSQRSTAGLQRLREYLRELSMTRQQRPDRNHDHLALLKCHADVAKGRLDLEVVADTFIQRTAARRSTFLMKKL